MDSPPLGGGFVESVLADEGSLLTEVGGFYRARGKPQLRLPLPGGESNRMSKDPFYTDGRCVDRQQYRFPTTFRLSPPGVEKWPLELRHRLW